jgi:hypothetical protein
MNIAIIGAGTASAVSTLALYEYLIDNELLKTCNVTCIYDPNVPITLVGESTSVIVPHLLVKVLRSVFPNCLDDFDGTARNATIHHWEAANGKQFPVTYGGIGLHINSEKFSNQVLTRLSLVYENFTKLPLAVTSITQDENSVTINNAHQFDYVIDCRGTPSQDELNSDQYGRPEFNFVNSVLIYPEFRSYDETYTSASVHDHGWMFGIPLQHRKAWGYLYNNQLTTEDAALENFEKVNKIISDIDITELRKISWIPYYKKQAMDNRILSMGNRLYFFEPTQAIPLHYYGMLTQYFSQLVFKDTDLLMLNKRVNYYHELSMSDIQDLIALSYNGKNNINSLFWNSAKEQSTTRLKKSTRFQQWLIDKENAGMYVKFWAHTDRMMKQYIEGFQVDLDKLRV